LRRGVSAVPSPDKQERAVEEHGQEAGELKAPFLRLVAKEPLPEQRPRPAAAEGEQVQGRFADPPSSALRGELVVAVGEAGEDAKQEVEGDGNQGSLLGR
jgi:hypothetical protein